MQEMFESRLGMHLQILTSPLNESNEQEDGISIVHVARDISERKLAEEQRREGVEKLLDTLEATIDSIATTAEIRDPYTASHQRRVSQLAYAIAKDVGLPENQTQGIRLAGLVHDIGKIYIPAEILSKPGDLIDIERDMIKMHPKIGHDILKHVEFPWPIAETVLQHHERMDGSGYPDGIVEEDILLEAKILAVADVVEAMSSHRPYRPSLSLEKALQEISSKSGICYDSRVVDSCVKLFNTGLFRFH
jgi:putative nucleotidyltransferase with HDIG domain